MRFCETCQSEITAVRLRAVPGATLCTTCQSTEESKVAKPTGASFPGFKRYDGLGDSLSDAYDKEKSR